MLSPNDINHEFVNKNISQLYVQNKMFIKPLRMNSMRDKYERVSAAALVSL